MLFKSNEYLLRKTFLKIGVLDEDKILGAQVKLNLYYIIRGPVEHDFPMELIGPKNKNKTSRIRLDIRISQFVNFQINPQVVQVKLLKEHPGEAFDYSLKYLTPAGKEIETDYSYYVENALYNTRLSDSEKEDHEKEKEKKKKSHVSAFEET